MATAWVVRSGKHGEREAWALANGYAGTGWWEFDDLTPLTTRAAIAQAAAEKLRNLKDGALANYTGQLWALRSRIQSGDLMVLPLKTTRQLALGRVTGGYEYRADEPDPNLRHVIPVEWQRTDVPRSAVKQDLLFTLGSALTIFAPSKNHAIARLEHLLTEGVDPGQVPFLPSPSTSSLRPVTDQADQSVDEPELVPDIEEAAQIQIAAKLAEEFAGHDLATLVTALLTIDGFVCRQSPAGSDGGVDILAGRGLLGLDDPLVLVQVKSGQQVGAPVVQQLHGAMTHHGATQGLLVSWGGLSKPARDLMQNQRMRVRLWEAPQVIDAVLAHYDALPEEIRAKIPLKRVWMLSDSRA
jgi:restriction system protein